MHLDHLEDLSPCRLDLPVTAYTLPPSSELEQTRQVLRLSEAEAHEVLYLPRGDAHVTLGVGGGFGNNVQVQVGDLWVRYAHLEAVLVDDGDQVAPGMVLGLERSTGFSTGPHLHFEVDRGCPAVACSIDPSGLISLPGGG
jgi:Peptidase family M23